MYLYLPFSLLLSESICIIITYLLRSDINTISYKYVLRLWSYEKGAPPFNPVYLVKSASHLEQNLSCP